MNLPRTRISEIFAHVPVLVRLELLGVVVALFVATYVGVVFGQQSRQVVTLVMPEADEVVWESRVQQFAGRISNAFGVKERSASQYAAWILESATRHKIEPELLASLIMVESTFDARARSNVGALGPAQVLPQFWSSVCRGDLHKPADNIDCGAHILASYREACGSRDCALAHYNVGPYAQKPRAARRYVAKIDRHRDRLERTVL